MSMKHSFNSTLKQVVRTDTPNSLSNILATNGAREHSHMFLSMATSTRQTQVGDIRTGSVRFDSSIPKDYGFPLRNPGLVSKANIPKTWGGNISLAIRFDKIERRKLFTSGNAEFGLTDSGKIYIKLLKKVPPEQSWYIESSLAIRIKANSWYFITISTQPDFRSVHVELDDFSSHPTYYEQIPMARSHWSATWESQEFTPPFAPVGNNYFSETTFRTTASLETLPLFYLSGTSVAFITCEPNNTNNFVPTKNFWIDINDLSFNIGEKSLFYYNGIQYYDKIQNIPDSIFVSGTSYIPAYADFKKINHLQG